MYWAAAGQSESALEAFLKSLILSPSSPSAAVRLAQHYLVLSQADLAHGLLNPLTQGNGWDVAEAWYFLAKTCEMQGGREDRVRECLVYALELEKGRMVRPLTGVVDRWLFG